jgi:DNA polymerase-4
VPVGQEKDFLAPLAVQKLPGVGEKTAASLRSMGIQTIGQLADIPPQVFSNRYGEGMIWLHQHARGIDSSIVETRGEAKSISRETTFSKDTMDAGMLKATLRFFAEKLGADLRDSGKKARTISLKLRYADFETVNRSYTSREAVNLDDGIFQEAIRLLEKTLGKKYKPVRLIGLEISNLVSGDAQLGLFNAETRRLEKLDRAIDHIRDKYGFDAIQTGYRLESKQKYGGKIEGK